MPNLFDDFDLDIQKVSTGSVKIQGITTTTVGVRSIVYSCEWLGCVEVGKTSDLCNSDNCSVLSYCPDC